MSTTTTYDAAGARAEAHNRAQGDDRAELDLWDTKRIPEGHDHARIEPPHACADVVVGAVDPAGSGT